MKRSGKHDEVKHSALCERTKTLCSNVSLSAAPRQLIRLKVKLISYQESERESLTEELLTGLLSPPPFSPTFSFSQNKAALKCSLLNLFSFSLSLCFSIIPCNFSLSASVYRPESPRPEPLHPFPPIRLGFTGAAGNTIIPETKKLFGLKQISKCNKNSMYSINNTSLDCAEGPVCS